MDTESQPTPIHENGAKIEDSSTEPPGQIAAGKDDVLKALRSTRQTRSRSQTPQKPKEKNDENLKSKKGARKNIDESMNGHSEKNSQDSDTKGGEKEEGEETSKKADSPKPAKSPETKSNTKKGKNDAGDTKSQDVDSKDILETEESKTKVTPKKHDKKESSQQSVSNEEVTISNTVSDPEDEVKTNELSKPESEAVEMDPLILAMDEPDPELQFDENSDLDSGKGSPIQLRCKTRRSHTRNIPTPKTPKSTDSESEKNSVAPTPTPENVNDTNDSLNIGDVSTRAEVGSDVTRLAYIANNSSIISEDNSYLNYSRERSLTETLRSLSPRKTIRPINDAYRQRAFRNNQNKTDLNLPYTEQDSTDSRTGVKRKRSTTPEDRKKFKNDSSFVSYLSSPLVNFKNRFITDASSSTPKLTGYKDNRQDLHEDVIYSEVVSEAPDKKNWCAIM